MAQKPLSTKAQRGPSQAGRKAAKFTARSKMLASAAALTALIGGWDWVGHLEAAKASAALQASSLTEIKAALVTPTGQPPTQPTPQPTPLPTIAPLSIAPIPTLPAPSGLLSQDVMAKLTANGHSFHLSAQAGAASVAAPSLAPLPALPPMPSLPPLPTNTNNGNNGGSNNNSGNNGGSSSSHRSGGS